jgi:predicted Ser/Thr protein kinase
MDPSTLPDGRGAPPTPGRPPDTATYPDDPTPSDPPAPAVPGYAVVRELGRGGMGAVYLAEDPKLGRRVAVKVMRAELAADAVARDRFVREARAAAAVRHDHVVPVYHVGEAADNSPFLVMPLLAGESLADRLSRGPLPPAEVARVGREAALGLAAAHAVGLVHRDVKPANLWLESPTDRVLLLDFGLARSLDASDGVTQAGAVLGTPGYLAPEQADGKPVDARADLFGLGATLYHAATGARPFAGPTLTAVLRAVAEHHPPPPRELNPAVPAGLSALIMRLLAKDPAGRPASAGAAAAELADYGPPADSVATVARPARRRWPAVAAGLAVLAAGVGVWLSTRAGSVAVPAGDPPPVTPPVVPQVAAAPSVGSVDLLVYRTVPREGPVLVPLWHELAMPLRTGDHFKFVAELDRPAFLYLFWIDEDGKALPVYPWKPGQWGTRPAAEEPKARLEVLAPDGRGFQVTGQADGMETVLMLARPTKLEAGEAEVQGWFRDLKPLAFGGPDARVWFEDFDVLRADQSRFRMNRGFKYAGGLTSADGPLGLQAELGRRIGKANAGYSRAVSFARVGKPEGK